MPPSTPCTPVPLKGQRILLRGLDSLQETQARASLLAEGYHVATSLALADILVTGDGNAGAAIEAAQKAGLPVLPWSEFSNHLAPTAPLAITDSTCHPAVEIGEEFVRILDQQLPRVRSHSRLVPAADPFRHLCHDACLLRNARTVALGARYGMPVLLEGDTSASKTTAIAWVAHLIGQPVLRLNLHGQTDTGELVGRYVPNTAPAGSTHPHRVPAASAARFTYVPTPLDSPTAWNKWDGVDPEAHATVPPWIFKEGGVPQGMRHGWWVLLDEINLAEPQVLERLNPVLESPPSLVLSEGDGTVFGPGGSVSIDPGFRLFATMNPAEYAGRSALSTAFRDRWLVWHQAEAPGESTFAAMLHRLVFGEHPEFLFRGRRYQSPRSAPAFPCLAGLAGIRDLLPRLAMFHASLSQASGMGGAVPTLGRVRKERYVFTRRSLLTCLRLLETAVREDPATSLEHHLRETIEVAYLGRLRDGVDRPAAVTLLRAAGLAER